MTQVRVKGTHEVFAVPQGSVLIVTPSRTTSAGRVTLNTSGVTPVGPWTVAGGSSTTIGPFSGFVDLTVESTSGTIFAEVTSSAALTAAQGAAGGVLLVAIPRTSAQLAAAPTATDVAVGQTAVFYDTLYPDRRFVVNAAGTLFVLCSGSSIVAQSAVPIALTGTTSATVLATIPVPANSMGPNGALRITVYWSCTNNVNSKNLVARWGSGATQMWSAGLTSIAADAFQVMVHNRGATGSQIMNGGGTGVSLGSLPAMNTASEDTTVAQNVQFTGTLAVGTDTMTLERYTIELLR